MSRFIFFLTLSFAYLGLMQTHSPFERQILDLYNGEGLLQEISNTNGLNLKHPYSIILTNIYKEGVFLKTNFASLKIISPFNPSIDVTYKISSEYYHYLKPYIGLEILRLTPGVEAPQNIFLPPGFSFVGNPILGYWRNNSNTKEREWHFYRFYRDLYTQLAWDTPIGNYQPTVTEYRQLKKLNLKGNRYSINIPDDSPFQKTRERDNLILSSPLFGARGTHTPYIATKYAELIKNNQGAHFTNVLISYYQNFLKPFDEMNQEPKQ